MWEVGVPGLEVVRGACGGLGGTRRALALAQAGIQ